MKTLQHLVLYALIIITGSLILCGDTTKPDIEGDDPDPVDLRSFIGTFEDWIPPKPNNGMPDTVVIGLKITEDSQPIDSTDSTFLLYSKELPNDNYLYKHSGTWRLAGSQLVLYGSYCEMIDVTTGAQSLEAQHDSIGLKTMQPENLDTALVVDSLWENIKIKDLGSIMRSIPCYTDPLWGPLVPSWDVDLEKLFEK